MNMILFKIKKIFLTSLIMIFVLSNSIFADKIEIRNGLKTTHADKPVSLIDTVNKNYSFKWALDKNGNWKLFIRRVNGRLINLSNIWVNLEKNVTFSDGTSSKVVDYYYFDINGNMVTGWYIDINNNIYFLNTDERELGKMARGWVKINGNYYYFNSNGVLLKDTITPDGFRVDATGMWK